jgi:hypothetical protein
LRGITIDSSDESENAFDSISVNLECDSKVTDERVFENAKHPGPRISTLRGITID